MWHHYAGAAILVGVMSPQAMQPGALLSPLTKTDNKRVSWFTFNCDTGRDAESVLWAVELNIAETSGGKVSESRILMLS